MFKQLAKTLCVVAALGAAGVAAPTAASAGGLNASVSIGSGGVDVQLVGHRHHRRHGHWERRGCSPRHAVRKARHRFGLHRAHIRRVNHRAVVVAGRKHGHRAVVRFARQRGCPVISFRY